MFGLKYQKRTSHTVLALLFFLSGGGTGMLSAQNKGSENQGDGMDGKEGKVINGYYDQKVFYHPDKGGYLETYITIDGKTLHYKKGKDGKRRSKVRITAMIKKGDSIVNADKTINHGPNPEGRKKIPNLVDVKRFLLDSGVYKVEIDLEDLNADTTRTFTIRSSVRIPHFDVDSMIFSQIQLVDRFRKSEVQDRYSKSGYRLIPYVTSIYPKECDKLNFYAELYNSQRALSDSERFAVRYYIYDIDKQKVMRDHYKIQMEQPQEVIPYLNSLDIADLSAGNYYLIMEARDQENELITKRSVYFKRKGSKEERKKDMLGRRVEGSFAARYDDVDSLRMYVRSLLPKADPTEAELITTQVETMSLQVMQQFLYSFWYSRNKEDPAKPWYAYKKLVDHVNREYGGTYKKGYQTDRGRVMLQYGKPDRIASRENKPHSYPYEIWQYYQIGRFTNKRFVFYNPSLSGKDYQLLHSDMPGEIRNRRWKRTLQDRQNIMDNVDEEGTIDHYGREVDDLFRNP